MGSNDNGESAKNTKLLGQTAMHQVYRYNSGFFLDISKKTQAQKTQNSRKILKKLKQNSEKTQKPATQVELNW